MTDLPTLIVGDIHDPEYWATVTPYTVRIDGPLPTVGEHKPPPHEPWCSRCARPLRVGDRITLATIEVEQDETSGGEWPLGPVPFATATVAEIGRARHSSAVGVIEGPAWLVTVTDVEAL